MKNVQYGNWEIYEPNGDLLFLTNEKRANWYLKRSLANKIGEFKVQLNFQPQGHNTDDFTLSSKENKCVVCGDTELNNLTKHHIIPYEFRKFLPPSYKNRSSHDVVPICRDCHNEYEHEFADKYKLEISEKYNIPINPYVNNKALNLANVLFNPNIPTDRLEQIRAEFTELTNITILTEKNVSDYVNSVKYIKHKTFGEQVVDIIKEEDLIFEFIKSWRLDFINNMNPKYMNKYWDINYKS